MREDLKNFKIIIAVVGVANGIYFEDMMSRIYLFPVDKSMLNIYSNVI